MGKIIMPKNSALLDEIQAVLKIYYESGDWLTNDIYKEKLKSLIGDEQYSSSYTKKAQITSYFGFTEWEDIHNARSKRRITESGKMMYESLINNDINRTQEIIMRSLETIDFGRNNFGVPDSNSDIEPPNLFIRAILDLNYLTYKEFAYLLWEMEDRGNNYTDVLDAIRNFRNSGTLTLEQAAEKYVDAKPIMMLVRWGFLQELSETSANGKKIVIDQDVLNKFETRLKNLKIYNIDKDKADKFFNNQQTPQSNRLKDGTNILLYGVPGSGKSYTIKNEYCKDESKIERVVFHPDYMNTDFIGQILPVVKADKSISYDFVPGPFTKIVKKAYEDPSNNYYLVIEEINRGNAPAIFGDVFQLLDRDEDGRSTYSITNQNIAEVVFNDPNKMVFIPSNLTILATMNTADQNVFTLDTAFQRRWLMRMIKNEVEKADHSNTVILDTNVNWATFAETINKQIIDSNSATMSSEDKRLGAYFITKDVLESDSNKMSDENFHSLFAEKVIKYLWDDAFKFGRDKLFNPVYKSLEDVIEDFSSKKGISRFDIFETSIRDLLKEKSKIILEEPSEEPEENTNTISDGE